MSKVLLSLVLAFVLFVASSDASNKVVSIDEICKQTTRNPSFCVRLLNSKPGAKDLVSLTQYTIDVDRTKLTNTITLLKSLIAKSKDPKAQAHYKDCLQRFDSEDGAKGDIDDTERALKTGDYGGVNIHASALFDVIDECISGEEDQGQNFQDPSLLPKYGGVIEDVTEIILVTSNLLRGA